jgi:hypothetical protein
MPPTDCRFSSPQSISIIQSHQRWEEHIARQREIVARLELLREPLMLQKARDLLRKMEHAQMLHVTERGRLREHLGEEGIYRKSGEWRPKLRRTAPQRRYSIERIGNACGLRP